MSESQYLGLLQHVLNNGYPKKDRTGTGTLSMFGAQMRFDLTEGFPLLTTKKVHTKSVVHELLWFISGSTNIRYLQANGVKIWDAWADENGDLGRVYGSQWRAFGQSGIDQLTNVVDGIKTNPDSRRHIVTSWNPEDLDKQALPPCHCFFQFDVTNGRLNCQLYQRSADLFLGVPFNIASYALLTHMVANVCGLGVGTFVHTLGDAHIYNDHVDQVKEQLTRSVRRPPSLLLSNVTTLYNYTYDDIQILGYDPHPTIKAPVSI